MYLEKHYNSKNKKTVYNFFLKTFYKKYIYFFVRTK